MLWLAAIAVIGAVIATGRRPSAVRLSAWSSARSPMPAPPAPPVRWLLGGLGGTAIVGLSVSPAVVVAVAVAVVVGCRVFMRRQARQRRAVTSAAVVEVTASLAAELRAGRTPAQALLAVAAVAGPLESSLRTACATVMIGGDAATELELAATVPGAERLRPVAAAWRVAASAGGRVAVVLERLAEAMDEDDELRRELDAALAAPKATMALLVGLPLFGIGLGQSAGADPIQLLVDRPLGWGLLAAAAVLDLVGLAIMRLIVTRAQPP